MAPLRGNNPIFFIIFFLSLQSSLYRYKLAFGRIVLIFNPLNGHYLYLPFFPNISEKRKKRTKGSKKLMPKSNSWIFFSGALKGVPIPKN